MKMIITLPSKEALRALVDQMRHDYLIGDALIVFHALESGLQELDAREAAAIELALAADEIDAALREKISVAID